MSQALAVVAAMLLVGYVSVICLLWVIQERIVFQPPRVARSKSVSAAQVRYRAADGADLFAYVVGDPSEQGVMIAFHGNAELARWLIPWAARVRRDTGLCVVLPEYRGYDGLGGSPTYASSSEDAAAAHVFVRERWKVSDEHVFLFGHSLGTAIAAELAARHPPHALILQAPFTSARDVAKRLWVPGLVRWWRLISRVHFDTVAILRNLDVPVWVCHGNRDRVVPVRMGREVFASAANKGELLIVPGAGHSDIADVGGASYWSWLRSACTGTSRLSAPDARSETRPEP